MKQQIKIMRIIVRINVAMVLTLGATAPASARAAQLYVAPNGNDTNSGTLEKPYARLFTPVGTVDARQDAEIKATSIRASDGGPLGSYRWLVWAVSPITGEIGGENSAYQELQVIPGR